jgi:hypothetical protein
LLPLLLRLDIGLRSIAKGVSRQNRNSDWRWPLLLVVKRFQHVACMSAIECAAVVGDVCACAGRGI